MPLQFLFTSQSTPCLYQNLLYDISGSFECCSLFSSLKYNYIDKIFSFNTDSSYSLPWDSTWTLFFRQERKLSSVLTSDQIHSCFASETNGSWIFLIVVLVLFIAISHKFYWCAKALWYSRNHRPNLLWQHFPDQYCSTAVPGIKKRCIIN